MKRTAVTQDNFNNEVVLIVLQNPLQKFLPHAVLDTCVYIYKSRYLVSC